MHLKRLELSGFKSFAKSTILEFSSPITAIVGPNGAGKSNIAEAIRWVLGEQSLKSLRGKKSEDLIFNGSEKAPRLGKASITLIFDNSKKQFPIEFEEVALQRKVYRDGINEYLINGSRVRLKDVVGLITNVGIGASGHHIISQGESDHILHAPMDERREMIEDALGLKIYQMKRRDSEKKLYSTEENIRQAKALRKEIQPHLKFLKIQAEKFQAASRIRENLANAYKEYLKNEKYYLDSKEASLKEKISEPKKELEFLEKELNEAQRTFEEKTSVAIIFKELKDIETSAAKIREKRLGLERELGKIEGIIELKGRRGESNDEAPVKRREIKDFIVKIKREIDEAEAQNSAGEIKKILLNVQKIINDFSNFFAGKKSDTEDAETQNFLKTKAGIVAELNKLLEEENKLNQKHLALREQDQKEREAKDRRQEELYEKQSRFNALKDALRTYEFEEEKLRLVQEEFEKYLKEAEHYGVGVTNLEKMEEFSESARENLKRAVERLKIKLEEAGGIDQAVMKEYSETLTRDQFFDKELKDLHEAASGCRKVIKDLEEKLEEEFKTGVEKINAEFQKFFASIFGGGKASLKIISFAERKQKAEEGEVPTENEESGGKTSGVDILVDVPRKRIKSINALSGGERALAASALLFAMSSVNPPPFLVLDEADAALDEANSKRYAEILNDLSKKTQLIIITHNRETMKQADVLYGVTMGQDSISRLLSVKLETAAQLAA